MRQVLMVWVDANPSTMEKNHLIASGLAKSGVQVIVVWLCHTEKSYARFLQVFGDMLDYEMIPGPKGELFSGRSVPGKIWNNLCLSFSFAKKLAQELRARKISVIITPTQPIELTLPTLILARVNGVPVVPNIMEHIPSLPSYKRRINVLHRLSWRMMVRYSEAYIVISHFLEERLGRSARKKEVFVLPVITDAGLAKAFGQNDSYENIDNHGIKNEPPSLIYTSSPAYTDILEFCLRSLALVKNSDYKLIITGLYKEGDNRRLVHLAEDLGIAAKLVFTGFLPDPELRALQDKSFALLIPLLDNERHQARFPQKIPTYMLLGKPVVSTRVGEIGRNFKDGENALVDETVTPAGYAAKIDYALTYRKETTQIALTGKHYIQKEFDYRLWGARLNTFLSETLAS